jgi:hypothetical protein
MTGGYDTDGTAMSVGRVGDLGSKRAPNRQPGIPQKRACGVCQAAACDRGLCFAKVSELFSQYIYIERGAAISPRVLG